eukprot:CAMPEP_0181391008 /NCGR_PEP_ID=MMETSP1106-20121128/25808_1 /TAXON_ID=81844 /ORGANISM="Mantoniella antarctica, Strain SL-175" /LENGTH=65 /DNA_ID=CAMNT_0023511995 /DNA_START=343 /DNA_END=535 /DNA_ORIENTATION=-
MGSVIEEFKMQGLSLRGDAMAAVVSFLDRSEDADAAAQPDARRALTTSIVSKSTVDEVVAALDRG